MIKNCLVSVLVIVICLSGTASFCADWKFYGEFSRGEGVDELFFYDASNITDSKGSPKLWVKTVLYSELEKLMGDKSINDKADEKIKSGYVSPISKIYPEVTNAPYIEEAANDKTVKASSVILYQISCTDRTMRKITGKAYNPDGTFYLGFGISKWESIAVGTNADNLLKIICNLK